MLLGAVIAGCGSSGGDEPAVQVRQGLISFSPIYSAWDGTHDYQITPYVPLVGADPATGADPIDAASLKWSLNSKYVEDKGPFLKPDGTPGLPGARLLQTKSAGTAVIEVTGTTLGGTKVKGSTTLNIAAATAAKWQDGEDRYNSDVKVDFTSLFSGATAGGMGDCGLPISLKDKIPTEAACTNCHNTMASALSIQHTPTQTGGYSDGDLIQIFTQATKPAGGKFNSPALSRVPTALAECMYKTFHTWTIADEVKEGIVYKLRSIPPATSDIDAARAREELMMYMNANPGAFGGGAAGAAP
jgi:hypothetical protein